jgi:pterin-4a-carbinolamine dehydratase
MKLIGKSFIFIMVALVALTLAAYNPSTAMAAMAKKAKKAKGIPHHPKISSIVKEQRNKKV